MARQGHALLGRVWVRHGRCLHVLFGKARGADVGGRAPLVGHVVVPRDRVERRALDLVAAYAGPPPKVLAHHPHRARQKGVRPHDVFEAPGDFLDDALALPACQTQKDVPPDRVREVHFFCPRKKKNQHRATEGIVVNRMSAPVGLKNHGNTCFINAIEQCFRSVEYYMGRQWPRPFATEGYPDLDQQDVHEYHLFVLMHLEETVPTSSLCSRACSRPGWSFPAATPTCTKSPSANSPSHSSPRLRRCWSPSVCGPGHFVLRRLRLPRHGDEEDGGGPPPPFTVFHTSASTTTSTRGDPINVPLRWEFVRNGNVYRLLGFVVHHGSGLDVGHYVAYVRYDRSWYLCNDDRIVEATNVKEEALPNAYMLFYGLTSLHAPTQIQPRAVRRR